VSSQEIRRALGWALVLSLCVAALTAIVAIVNGRFDDTDWRVIGTSIGFGVFSAIGAAGTSPRLQDMENGRLLGLATMALAAISFVLLPVALWTEDGDGPWVWWGCFSLAALAASHASLVLGARRRTDGDGARMLTTASVVLATIDAAIGIGAISGFLDDVDEGGAQALAVLVILLILTTALPPILRRLGGRPEPAAVGPLARELLAAADRIEALNGHPGIQRECDKLRRLARDQLR
jgi:hypothetical protein